MFFKGSRYEKVATRRYTALDGRIIRYKSLRRIAPTTGLTKHIVDDGDRLDHISFEEYRDPERFWRICDANLVIRPEELTDRPGRVLEIPPSEG